MVINRGVSIGHHSILEEYAACNPGVTVSGQCVVGEGATIGSGATVLDQKIIGDGSIVGAGSVVTKDIPKDVVAYGVPAKVIKSITSF